MTQKVWYKGAESVEAILVDFDDEGTIVDAVLEAIAQSYLDFEVGENYFTVEKDGIRHEVQLRLYE